MRIRNYKKRIAVNGYPLIINNSVSTGKKVSSSGTGLEILAFSADNNQQPMTKLAVSEVSFVACGDNLIHSTVYSDAEALASGTGRKYNFLPMYENVADIISEADIAFINQETPFGGDIKPVSGYPMFNTPDQMGRMLPLQAITPKTAAVYT